MNPTRRDVCQAGLFGAVAFVIGGCNERASGYTVATLGQRIPAEATASDQYALSLSSFAPQVGSAFVVADDSGARTTLKLVAAVDQGIGDRPVMDRGECFVLRFEADGASSLEQNTYQASHASLGDFPLFIVPGPRASHQTYTAVFNRV